MTLLAGTTTWVRVCDTSDLEPFWGEVALIGGRQIAVVLIGPDEVYAVDHIDPHMGSPVMARGIVGSKGDRPTLASPLHKEVYDLVTGECYTDPSLSLQAFRTRVVDGAVEIEVEEAA
ncbi:nitrite reductase small subunit NirD [Agromyces sp. LHK192]|uniref:nitrite reductase small subunit NirD n=1 Tax=Agromyces sp. LHK192 TaxID=2498704 RepID=UPI000FDAB722|nr:nitrite reductase small subunit NirD [Agromyces sp. LHK192]